MLKELLNKETPETGLSFRTRSGARYRLTRKKDEDGFQPLHRAAANGWRNTVITLLGHGAQKFINDRDENGQTALFCAVGNKRFGVAQLLCAYGADIFATNLKGISVLTYTLRNSGPHMINLLLRQSIV